MTDRLYITSVTSYQSTLCKIPQERRSHLYCSGSLKSPILSIKFKAIPSAGIRDDPRGQGDRRTYLMKLTVVLRSRLTGNTLEVRQLKFIAINLNISKWCQHTICSRMKTTAWNLESSRIYSFVVNSTTVSQCWVKGSNKWKIR
jgi:hypothetical protein